jgi:hypothetical protein
MISSDGTNGMVMPVAPAYGGSGGFGNAFGGDWAWILLLLLLCGNGWGNGFGGFGGGDMYPWMNQQNQINDGFRDQMLNGSITGIQQSVTTGFGDVQNTLCSGFAGVNANIANGFAQAEIAENGRQMANMNQMFGIQTALNQCCCENRAATADLKYTVATEACADRNAISTALRDVLESNNANTQKILDTLCQDKIDAKNERIAELQNQLTMANLAASQNLQTQQILAGQDRGVNALEQYLAPTPRPAYIVQNPNCCAPNFGCGCAA